MSLPAAQEFTVTGTHVGETALHQPNGPITQRRGLPCLALNASNAKESLGDLPIGCFGEVTIECAQHQDKAIASLSRERTRFSAMIGRSSHEPHPEPQRSVGADRQSIIERHDD